MHAIANALVILTALLHLLFLVLEMFLWTRPLGLQVFMQSPEKARDSAVLAMNQGLYNGFLSAGLVWGLLHPDSVVAREIEIFFLSCVLVAGVFGAMTVNRRIFLIQGLPGLIALAWVLFAT